MKYLIGLDIGTSSVKGVLMTVTGEIIFCVSEKFYYNVCGKIVEIEAQSFFDTCCKAIKALTDAAKDNEICALCTASASGNLLLLDEKNNPITPIINWQDKRVEKESTEILGEYNPEEIYKKVGWTFSGVTLPLAQLCYIKKHNPKLLADCGMVCMSTEYLYYELTGKWGVSNSTGTPFYLIDQVKGEYVPEFMDALGIDKSKLPPIIKSGTILGNTTEAVFQKTGIPAGIPVVLGNFDHPSAARGVGVLKEGEMLLSCGTSWVGFLPVMNRDKLMGAKTLIDPFLSSDGGCWAGMVSLSSVSHNIKKYVNRYIDDSENRFSVLSSLAKKSSPGAGGLVINPQAEPDDEVILKYEKHHIARAIMEGVIILLKERLDGLKEKGITADSAVMVGGPSEDPVWIEIMEQICDISVKVTYGASAGAVGAAVVGGIGAGIYDDEYHAKEILSKGRE